MPRVERAASPLDVERIPGGATTEAAGLVAHRLVHVAQVPGKTRKERERRERDNQLAARRAQVRRQFRYAPKLGGPPRIAIGYCSRRRHDARGRREDRPSALAVEREPLLRVEV